MSKLFLGMMSGTSMDAVDACLTDFADDTPKLVATHSEKMPAHLQSALSDLMRTSAEGNVLVSIGRLDAEIGEFFASTALALLATHGYAAEQISAIGSHGQTVWHQPDGPHPFSMQLGDPARIAERTGITTVADFRRRDIAAGGQGAPLVPAFHAAVFHAPGESRVILNIGGMANVTLLPAGSTPVVRGFDTGPGNILLDLMARRHLDAPYDLNGVFAAQGRCNTKLLESLLSDPYFALPPPKSTGRELFNGDWLDRHLAGHDISPADTQNTLTELTARSIVDAIDTQMPGCQRVLVCGGGAHNTHLMSRLESLLPAARVATTAANGIPPEWVEAMAFGWLAHRTLNHQTGNLPAVTGARRAVILGAIHPA